MPKNTLPKFSNEADAWHHLAKWLADGKPFGICIGILRLYWREQISLHLRQIMQDRLSLFQPDGRDSCGYWWNSPDRRDYDRDSRIIACCLLAALAEDGVTL